MRLIDADEISYERNCSGCLGMTCEYCEDYIARKEYIDEMPNALQTPKGKWVKRSVDITEHPYHCSICGWSEPHIPQRYVKDFKYCPECGGKMSER